MDKVTEIPIVELNPLLTCPLCKGYIIDATTVVECLHSFCKTCIINHLSNNDTCPVCDTLLHKTRPECAIRSDYALQAIVYKLLPKVFEREMSSRRNFYKTRSTSERGVLSPEKRGDISLSAYVEREEERVSVELCVWRESVDKAVSPSVLPMPDSLYLLCPPALTVGHLEKLLRLKFDLPASRHRIEFFFPSSNDDKFTSDFTLSDLVCLHTCSQASAAAASLWNGAAGHRWMEAKPLRLFFSLHPVAAAEPVSAEEAAVPSISRSANAIALSSG